MAGRVYNYSGFRKTASRLVDKFGLDAELRQGGVDHRVRIVLTDCKSNRYSREHIMRGDFVALLAASDTPVVPKPSAILFWEGRERTIVSITTTKPGPDAILYELQIQGVR